MTIDEQILKYLRQREHMCFRDYLRRDLEISDAELSAALARLEVAKQITTTGGGRLVGGFTT